MEQERHEIQEKERVKQKMLEQKRLEKEKVEQEAQLDQAPKPSQQQSQTVQSPKPAEQQTQQVQEENLKNLYIGSQLRPNILNNVEQLASHQPYPNHPRRVKNARNSIEQMKKKNFKEPRIISNSLPTSTSAPASGSASGSALSASESSLGSASSSGSALGTAPALGSASGSSLGSASGTALGTRPSPLSQASLATATVPETSHNSRVSSLNPLIFSRTITSASMPNHVLTPSRPTVFPNQSRLTAWHHALPANTVHLQPTLARQAQNEHQLRTLRQIYPDTISPDGTSSFA